MSMLVAGAVILKRKASRRSQRGKAQEDKYDVTERSEEGHHQHDVRVLVLGLCRS